MIKPIALFLIALTILISPYRNSVSQDDAPYSYSAVSLAKGSGEIHSANVAMIFPQLLIGVAALKVVPFLPALSVLNFTTWICFGLVVILFARLFVVPGLLLLTFFSFPLWIQYGTSYLSEIYSGLLLVLLMTLLIEKQIKNKSIELVCLALVSCAIGLQIQNMVAFPFLWGAFYILRRERKGKGAALIFGSLLSLVIFAIIPKTPFQQGYMYWMMKLWLEQGWAAVADYPMHLLKLILALGVYLIPFLSLSKLSKKGLLVGLASQILILVLLYATGQAPLSSGVIFLVYFPNIFGLTLLSFGVWGWMSVYQFARKDVEIDRALPLPGTILALVAMFLFSTYRHAIDYRYFMTWALPIALYMKGALKADSTSLGHKRWFFSIYFVISIFLNQYSLSTTDERWNLARDFESKGVPSDQISAGLGRDAYTLEHRCIQNILGKLSAIYPEPIWKEREFFDRIINFYDRSHTDQWVPRYLIKPGQVLGKKLNLQMNRLPGQDGDPVQVKDYSVFGIPSQLVVFENTNPQPGWCFR